MTPAQTQTKRKARIVSRRLADAHCHQAVHTITKNKTNIWCAAWRQGLSRQAVSGKNPETLIKQCRTEWESCIISWQRIIIQIRTNKHKRQLPSPGILAQIRIWRVYLTQRLSQALFLLQQWLQFQLSLQPVPTHENSTAQWFTLNFRPFLCLISPFLNLNALLITQLLHQNEN